MIARAETHFETHSFAPFAAELWDGGVLAGFVGLVVPQFEAHFTLSVEIG